MTASKKKRHGMTCMSIQFRGNCPFVSFQLENIKTSVIHVLFTNLHSGVTNRQLGDLTKMTEFKHFFYLRHTVNVLFGFFLITQYFKLASLIFQGFFFCNGHKIYSESTGNKSNRLTRVYIHALNLKKKTSVLHRKKNLIIRQLNFKQKLI